MNDLRLDDMLFEAVGTLVECDLVAGLSVPVVGEQSEAWTWPAPLVSGDRAVFDTGVPHVSLSLSRIKEGYFPRDVPLNVPLGDVVLSLWWGLLGIEELYTPDHHAQVARVLFDEVVLNPRLVDWQLQYYFMAEAVVAYQVAGGPVMMNVCMADQPPRDDELGRGVGVAAELFRLCREEGGVEAKPFEHLHSVAEPAILPRRTF